MNGKMAPGWEGGSQCWRAHLWGEGEGQLWGGEGQPQTYLQSCFRGSPYFLSSLLGKGLVTTWGRGSPSHPTEPTLTTRDRPRAHITKYYLPMGRGLHCPRALMSSELTHLPRGCPGHLHLKMSGDREAIALETVLNRNWALQVQR